MLRFEALFKSLQICLAEIGDLVAQAGALRLVARVTLCHSEGVMACADPVTLCAVK